MLSECSWSAFLELLSEPKYGLMKIMRNSRRNGPEQRDIHRWGGWSVSAHLHWVHHLQGKLLIGQSPSHLDSHWSIHIRPGTWSVLISIIGGARRTKLSAEPPRRQWRMASWAKTMTSTRPSASWCRRSSGGGTRCWSPWSYTAIMAAPSWTRTGQGKSYLLGSKYQTEPITICTACRKFKPCKQIVISRCWNTLIQVQCCVIQVRSVTWWSILTQECNTPHPQLSDCQL